ncbi:MAG TPA: hypothetical protein VGD10_06505 [Allosphingosinicella sp.]|uniref:hypothetical protein n=1 Tax=Allosphingosinicella sp. TaxID=2823234 RepID=UPI002EDBA2D2
MRVDAEELKMKALLALEEGAQLVHLKESKPSLGIRFALAYLYAIGDGEKWIFNNYWNAVTGKAGTNQSSTYLAEVVRNTEVESALNGIWRSVGIERTVTPELECRKALFKLRPDLHRPRPTCRGS